MVFVDESIESLLACMIQSMGDLQAYIRYCHISMSGHLTNCDI
jgi:hypothetical protein